MVDLFYMYVVNRGSASRYDWLNHVMGAREMMRQSGSLFQASMDVAAFVRHPDSFYHGLELLSHDDNTYTAYDENNPAIMLDLNRQDVELIELPPMPFGKWMLSLLELPIRSRIRLLCDDKLFHFQILGRDLYVSAAGSVGELSEHLAAMNTESPALCIALDATLERYECVARMLGEADRVSYSTIHDYVEFKEGAYVYTNPVPLINLLKEMTTVSPDAKFLPRPEGYGWNDLHIQIRSTSHHDTLHADKDIIEAWYEDSSGRTIGNRKRCRVVEWSFFYRNGEATYTYKMLKLFAAHKGLLSIAQSESINNINRVRTNLRQFLCQQFGYHKDDSPIVEEVAKSRMFRTEFSISFADANSDPLAEKRGRIRTPLRD